MTKPGCLCPRPAGIEINKILMMLAPDDGVRFLIKGRKFFSSGHGFEELYAAYALNSRPHLLRDGV